MNHAAILQVIGLAALYRLRTLFNQSVLKTAVFVVHSSTPRHDLKFYQSVILCVST